MIVMILGSMFGAGSAAAEESERHATWLWNPWMFVEDEAATVAFLEEKQVTDVYVQVDQDVPMADYRSFIRAAGERGMDVHALDGAPDWMTPEGIGQLSRMLGWVTEYEWTAGEGEGFAGVHLDVEPYIHPLWNENRQEAVTLFQEMVAKALPVVHALDLELELDLPFWFDEITYDNDFGTGSLAGWAIREADGVTLMAYRDTAAAIQHIVKEEMAYGEQYDTPVTVGVETMYSYEGDHVSFYQQGEAYMMRELNHVRSHYENSPAFAGFSIHHVASWQDMRP
ncbi:hypothetical protein ALCH109712_07550 [Alkalicoccus chagannorensis]